jgi:hypothetical protein
MALADFVLVWVGGALLIGFVGFFAVLLMAVFRLVGRAFRALFPAQAEYHAQSRLDVLAPQVCGQPRCGYLNRGAARYCARCGSALEA